MQWAWGREVRVDIVKRSACSWLGCEDAVSGCPTRGEVLAPHGRQKAVRAYKFLNIKSKYCGKPSVPQWIRAANFAVQVRMI